MNYWKNILSFLLFTSLYVKATPFSTPESNNTLLTSKTNFFDDQAYIILLKNGYKLNNHLDFLREHVSSSFQKNSILPKILRTFELPSFIGYSARLSFPIYQLLQAATDVLSIIPDELVYAAEITADKNPKNYTLHSKELPVNIIDRDNNFEQLNTYTWALPRISSKEKKVVKDSYLYPKNAGENITVFVIDTGVDVSRKEFENRASLGFNAIDGLENHTDFNGHGTFVSGIIASDVFGTAKKASIVSVKALSSDGSGHVSDVIAAIQWIILNHKKNAGKSIINYSISGLRNLALMQAQSSATKEGFLFVGAAGNEGQDACDTNPGDNEDLIIVGSIDKTNTASDYSNKGKCVDIWAPGGSVSSLDVHTNYYATRSGTSFAAPHVSGILALILSLGIESHNAKSMLLEGATKDIIKRLDKDSVNILAYNLV